jgi:hypothetical protein
VWIANVLAHDQRLVSVVKMATVLEGCITEEQHSVVHFCGQKDSVQRVLIKKCFLFALGSVCQVNWFTARSGNSLKDVQKMQVMSNQVALMRLQ